MACARKDAIAQAARVGMQKYAVVQQGKAAYDVEKGRPSGLLNRVEPHGPQCHREAEIVRPQRSEQGFRLCDRTARSAVTGAVGAQASQRKLDLARGGATRQKPDFVLLMPSLAFDETLDLAAAGIDDARIVGNERPSRGRACGMRARDDGGGDADAASEQANS